MPYPQPYKATVPISSSFLSREHTAVLSIFFFFLNKIKILTRRANAHAHREHCIHTHSTLACSLTCHARALYSLAQHTARRSARD